MLILAKWFKGQLIHPPVTFVIMEISAVILLDSEIIQAVICMFYGFVSSPMQMGWPSTIGP